jgi:hypothetical protein
MPSLPNTDLALVSAENSTRELLHSADSQMLEIVVTPRSPLVGRTPGANAV